MKKGGGIPLIAAHLGAVHIEISGNREVVFEGSRGIVNYSESNIKINAGKYIVSFSGRGLKIQCMNDTAVVICGFITSIEYLV